MHITRIRDWATGHTNAARNEAVIVRHADGRAVRFEFDSDDDFFYVYTSRWIGGNVREGQDPVRRFRRA
jgi:hypothetical protein